MATRRHSNCLLSAFVVVVLAVVNIDSADISKGDNGQSAVTLPSACMNDSYVVERLRNAFYLTRPISLLFLVRLSSINNTLERINSSIRSFPTSNSSSWTVNVTNRLFPITENTGGGVLDEKCPCGGCSIDPVEILRNYSSIATSTKTGVDVLQVLIRDNKAPSNAAKVAFVFFDADVTNPSDPNAVSVDALNDIMSTYCYVCIDIWFNFTKTFHSKTETITSKYTVLSCSRIRT